MRAILLSGFLVLGLACVTGAASPLPTPASKALASETSANKTTTQTDLLQRFMNDTRPAQASFTQKDDRGSSAGKLVVGPNGRLRWEQLSPFPLLLVSNGKIAWQVDTDLMQATRLDAQMTEGWASVFGNRQALEKTYTVQQKGQQVILTPRRADGVKGTIEFDSAGNPILVRLGAGPTDKNSQSATEIRFVRWTRLRPNSNALFDYQPTKGMDIVGAN